MYSEMCAAAFTRRGERRVGLVGSWMDGDEVPGVGLGESLAQPFREGGRGLVWWCEDFGEVFRKVFGRVFVKGGIWGGL